MATGRNVPGSTPYGTLDVTARVITSSFLPSFLPSCSSALMLQLAYREQSPSFSEKDTKRQFPQRAWQKSTHASLLLCRCSRMVFRA